MSPGQRLCPADLGKAGCLLAPPLRPSQQVTRTERPHAWTADPDPVPPGTPCPPPPGMIRSRTIASRAPAAPLRGRCAPLW